MAACQSRSQSILIDQWTTGGVDKNGATLHLRQSSDEARVRLMNILIANVKAFIDGTPQNLWMR